MITTDNTLPHPDVEKEKRRQELREFLLPERGLVSFDIPAGGARILGVAHVPGKGLVLWATCYPRFEPAAWRFGIYPTGATIGLAGDYVGTAIGNDGQVSHVFCHAKPAWAG